MTKKDCVKIAAAINNVRSGYSPHWNPNLFRAVDDVAKEIARVCEADNAGFDRKRFLATCGVPA